jgi:hypothetical protein
MDILLFTMKNIVLPVLWTTRSSFYPAATAHSYAGDVSRETAQAVPRKAFDRAGWAA